MGIMKEWESSSSLFGANAPFIEELYETWLGNPDAVPAEWAGYFVELRGDAKDVPHAPVVASFVELGKSRRVQGAMIDATTMAKQVSTVHLRLTITSQYSRRLIESSSGPPGAC